MGINFKQSQSSLEHATKIAQDLERLLKQQEALISRTKAAASHAKESPVLLTSKFNSINQFPEYYDGLREGLNSKKVEVKIIYANGT